MQRDEYRAYREARKLAKKIGCDILIERNYDGDELTMTYWVFGPEEVYGRDDMECRRDPCEHQHCWAGWNEVLDALRDYDNDLFFNRLGIDSDTTDCILALRTPGLLVAWLEDKDSFDRGMVLADWLEEQRNPLADVIRKALTSRLPRT